MTDVANRLTEREALALAVSVARRGPGGGANPRVGCVILAPGDPASPRSVLGVGWHRGAGTPHAEVAAIAAARTADPAVNLTGATAIVTLQPCNSTGRTGPCAHALASAGIARVRYAVEDPAADRAGSDAYLAGHAVDVRGPRRFEPGEFDEIALDSARELVHAWLSSMALGRPYVTLKIATTLDARIAAPDGTSQWITGAAARANAHEVRAEVGAIVVGSGTVAADDPTLTARTAEGGLAEHQPLRVVLGLRDVPAQARLRGPGGELVHIRSRDPRAALRTLADAGVTHALVEGGAQVSAAFLRAGLADEITAYIAPKLLGGGLSAIADFGVATLADAAEFAFLSPRMLGEDVLLTARARPETFHGKDR
ncbi:bifunctional diaminohydroxyphosphoribosylaminopyrimidine deaminase/5-amino-6-(5-phosphoribosylamino)uracil reductase RibD [Rarobacter faecitabidus]|uniref:Riboflavin biosynthesis protein RibD n=1 Tax=Rarobacter faecitabidus TaxID=13243 RepID=A0A542ZW09_RARFA|nr:diaminohydroxyphosphoribosylaminopyrimidine deaminase/5-amino-6-(5-phosphoribosylamino)uracil reductase [Rarobacter faecitabidus]